jgi:galactitol-specific phosphotransferase system IIC component
MLQPYYTKGLAVLIVYVATVFSGGYVVRYLTKSLVRDLPRVPDATSEHLQNAGMYIGWLERTLILTAVIMRSPATSGLVLTAKSIVRYQEMKSGRFAEYFLIGTLLSIVLAIFGGILLLKVLHSSVDFAS